MAEQLGVGKPYPYVFEGSCRAGTLLTLDMLGGELTFEELFTRDFRSILRTCRRRAADSIKRAQDHTGETFPPFEEFWEALDAVCLCLGGSETLRSLMEQLKESWPATLEEKMQALVDLGFYIHVQLIPDEAKKGIAHYFSDYGDDFLGREGSLAFQDYFELPRSALTQEQLDLLEKGRRLGVLLCHPDSPDSTTADDDDKDSCWNGSNCIPTTLFRVCFGNSPASDPC